MSSVFQSNLSGYAGDVENCVVQELKEAHNVSDPILQWSSSPTLEWLMNGHLYEKVSLKNQYTDPQDYVDTVRKVWIMLTFYWGTAALWPKCGCHSNSGPVNESRACSVPLLTPVLNGNNICTKKGSNSEGRCGRPAIWRCMRKDHDAICRNCLLIRQKSLFGPSGTNASTDLYDGVIQSIQLHGDAHILHLKDVLSRKPPKENVNWRTSYRLQPSMLVGIIQLHGRDLELQPSMKIHWGEIVLKHKQAGPNDEYERRRSGNLSIRLLSRSDCPDLIISRDALFLKDANVAIVDMRVFVPEVITVLSTLSQKSFLDGFTRVAFSNYLLAPREQHGSIEISDSLYSSSLHDHLREAFRLTTIDSIVTLSEERKQSILEQICNLKVVQTLDKTQREAYVNALLRPLHCTQGPPGTGKSYVGVCLVLSLIIIRNNLRKYGSHVGPILALSYKNHAIDEFLVDVLNNNSERLNNGKLIRLGKPENEKLFDYTEKHSNLESHAHRELESRLVVLKTAYAKLQQWMLARDIAVKIGTAEIAECLMVAFLYTQILDNNPEDEDEDEDDNDDSNESDSNKSIEDNFNQLQFILAECNSRRLENIVPLLCSGLEHWRFSSDEQRSMLLLEQWLQGNNPPPRCEHFIDNQRYCEARSLDSASHFCTKFHACESQNCLELRSHLSPKFCDVHRCLSAEICGNTKLDNFYFCLFHCCIVCLTNEREIGSSVCRSHCCNFFDCINPKLGEFPFCLDHCCPTCFQHGTISKTSFSDQRSVYCASFHRCLFPQCTAQKEFNTNYCKNHTCLYCDDHIIFGTQFCVNHKCSNSLEDCMKCVTSSKKNGTISKFCEEHTCRFCVENGNELNQEVSLSSLTCSEHLLCANVDDDGNECINLSINGTSFCAEHNLQFIQHTEHCSGITKKGKPCKSKRPENCVTPQFYCNDHKDQAKKATVVVNTNIDINSLFMHLDIPYRQQKQPVVHRMPECRKCCHPNCSYLELLSNSNSQAKKNDYFYCNLHSYEIRRNSMINQQQQLSGSTNKNLQPLTSPSLSINSKPQVLSFEEVKDELPLDEDIEVAEQTISNNNLDEMTMENPDDFIVDETSDQIKHFQDIYQEEIDETIDNNEIDDVIIQDIDEIDIKESLDNIAKCIYWDWEMTNGERQKTVFTMITSVCRIITELIHYAEAHVDEARQLKAEASAHLLKAASVIGGTVVGAARRLAALRAAEPFAIIVEEACEVMEPTLVSVLAVESVKKLELIGDHRQLPAFVNQCWYNLECSIPSIKTSLFERIIISEDSRGSKTQRRDNICSILDIQRRMRTCISNLTKGEYQDLVAIEDHPVTASQKICDKLSKKNTPPLKKAWEFGGRSVPGIQSCIYFWDLQNNSESRPIAGLSACNENEALSVVELVKYLSICGIPKECITIITPYDGQKRLIIQCLRKQNLLPKERTENTLLVSTVDRYQGDENDIIILSLVRTRPGNRFVGLLNRFIVATSRARLGFFIIGSKNAVVHNNEGPKHWKSFIEQLSHPDLTGCDTFQLPRIGHQLPICCPLHHQSQHNISSLKEQRIFPSAESWNNYCTVLCPSPLGCGHPCGLTCHLPNPNAHNSNCQQEFVRPCSRHRKIPVICHTITRKEGHTSERALKTYWRCSEQVSMRLRSCGHDMTLPCADEEDITKEELDVPLCEKIMDDFIQPSCGHHISGLKCHVYYAYLKSPPRCEEEVTVKLENCEHKKKIKCFQNEKRYFLNNPCKEAVRAKRPRCHHDFNMRCKDYQTILSHWEGESYDDVEVHDNITIVNENGDYGPSESDLFSQYPICKREVKYIKPCGHSLNLQCNDAFQMSKDGSPQCDEKTTVNCILCKGSIHIPCHKVEEHTISDPFNLLQSLISRNNNGVETKEGNFVNAKIFQNNIKWNIINTTKCKTKVRLQRSCHPEHFIELTCFEIYKIFILREKELPICNSPFPLELDCGHSIEVKCSKKHIPPQPCRQPNLQDISFTNCNHTIRPNTCGEYQRLINDPDIKCTREISYSLFRCHHPTLVKCSEMSLLQREESGVCLPSNSNIVLSSQIYCQPSSIAPICKSFITYQYECGHHIENIPCCDAFSWSEDNSLAPLCKTIVPYLNPLCGHEIEVPCSAVSILSTWEPWTGRPSPNAIDITLDDQITQAISYPSPPPFIDNRIINIGIKCKTQVGVHFKDCGHCRFISCHEVYNNQSQLFCTEIVENICEKCTLPRKLSCHNLHRLTNKELILQCDNKCSKLCQRCQINSMFVPCNQNEISCNCNVEYVLPCGHLAKWRCGTDVDPRLSYDSNTGVCTQCTTCALSKWQIDNELELNMELFVNTCKNLFIEIAEVGKTCSIIDETVIVDLGIDSKILTAHETVRHQIISKLQDAIQKNDSTIIFPNQYGPLEEYIKTNYRLVFLPIPMVNNPNPDQLRNRCQLDMTPYGRGKLINILNNKSLSKLVSAVNGQAKMCIGLAFQSKTLQNTPPFVVGKPTEATKKHANQSLVKFMKQGYDSVEIVKDDSIEMVYWTHGVILPLLTVKLQYHTSCSICGDYFTRNEDSGILCSNNHFHCYECYRGYLNAAKQDDAINTYINKNGEVTCPDCKTAYSLYQLNSNNCPQDIFQTVQEIKINHELQKNATLVRKEAEEKMKQELERIQQLSVQDREVFIKRQRIITILTPACPRCNQAFIDFTGCFALTCGNNQCQCGFCAWCFKDCDRDAHAHVPHCRWGIVDGRQLGVYGDVNLLNRVWNNIRREKINRELFGCDNQIRTKVLESLKKEFRDIKLVM